VYIKGKITKCKINIIEREAIAYLDFLYRSYFETRYIKMQIDKINNIRNVVEKNSPIPNDRMVVKIVVIVKVFKLKGKYRIIF
jgi:hypothetical protein